MDDEVLAVQNEINSITFTLLSTGEIGCSYKADDLNQFLQMLILILSGDVNQDVIDSVFDEIDHEEIKAEFLDALEKYCIEIKVKKKDKPVVSPSEYRP